MDQDYIRSRYGGEGQEHPPPASEPAPGAPATGESPAAAVVENLTSHIPHLSFGGDSGEPWYEARWAIVVFALLLGPVIGIFVWWVITRYDLEFRVKLIASGLSILLTLIVALLL